MWTQYLRLFCDSEFVPIWTALGVTKDPFVTSWCTQGSGFFVCTSGFQSTQPAMQGTGGPGCPGEQRSSLPPRLCFQENMPASWRSPLCALCLPLSVEWQLIWEQYYSNLAPESQDLHGAFLQLQRDGAPKITSTGKKCKGVLLGEN